MMPIPLDTNVFTRWRLFHESEGDTKKLSACPGRSPPPTPAVVITLLTDETKKRNPIKSLDEYNPAEGARHSFGVLVRGVSLRWLGVTSKSTGQIIFVDEIRQLNTTWGGEFLIDPKLKPEAQEICAQVAEIGRVGRPDTITGEVVLLGIDLKPIDMGSYSITIPATVTETTDTNSKSAD
jgi:hypothetical protein